jgi:death-on-curing protein
LSDREHLTLEDEFELIGVLKVGPLRDLGLLHSALARTRSSAFGQDAYVTMDLKASALLHSLVKNHPLVDGNERLAWLSTTVFLLLNGHEANLRNDEAFALVLEVASGSLEREEIAQRLRVRTVGPEDDS